MKEKPVYLKSHPIYLFAAGFIVIAGLRYAAPIINPVLMAIFVSIIIYQPIDWLIRRKVNRALSILLVMASLAGIMFGLSVVINQSLKKFTQNLPVYKEKMSVVTEQVVVWLNSFGANLHPDDVLSKFGGGNVFGYAANFLTTLGGLMGQLVLLILVVMFVIGESTSYAIKLKAILKKPDQSMINLGLITRNVRNYLGMKTITGSVAAILVALLMVVMDVPYAVIWGLLVFIFRFIPNIGSTISAIPIMLFVLIQNGISGVLYAGIGYGAINFIVGQIVEPRFLAKGMDLSTLVVFLSLVFWGWVFGDIGMLLSVPITMAIKISLGSRKKTQWIAVLLGSEKNAREVLENRKRKGIAPSDNESPALE
ncbi:MAG: AI-2E family transporter [Bacteroidales bacterium]|jgi:predicted PurR-regulated permease PerM